MEDESVVKAVSGMCCEIYDCVWRKCAKQLKFHVPQICIDCGKCIKIKRGCECCVYFCVVRAF